MGSRVTQPGSAVGEGEKFAEGDSSRAEGSKQSRSTSPNNSDSKLPGPSNLEHANRASQGEKSVGMPSIKAKRRILIVDDETAIADTLALIFRTQRYEVRVAYSGESAIEVIAEWRPDLAIIDVILPEMNGIDLAIVTKCNYPGCHVLLFSGHANTTMLLEEASRKGHQFEVLAKPVHPTVMLERAADLLNGPEEPAYD